jgi:hypothetical protein
MILFNGISLLILGIFTVPTLFLPEKWARKITPCREYIVMIYFIVGILEIILCILNPQWFDFPLFIWIITLICAIDKTQVGFMLGFNTIAKIFKKKNKTSKGNIDFIHFKTTMGIITVGLGFCMIVIYLVMKIG